MHKHVGSANSCPSCSWESVSDWHRFGWFTPTWKLAIAQCIVDYFRDELWQHVVWWKRNDFVRDQSMADQQKSVMQSLMTRFCKSLLGAGQMWDHHGSSCSERTGSRLTLQRLSTCVRSDHMSPDLTSHFIYVQIPKSKCFVVCMIRWKKWKKRSISWVWTIKQQFLVHIPSSSWRRPDKLSRPPCLIHL